MFFHNFKTLGKMSTKPILKKESKYNKPLPSPQPLPKEICTKCTCACRKSFCTNKMLFPIENRNVLGWLYPEIIEKKSMEELIPSEKSKLLYAIENFPPSFPSCVLEKIKEELRDAHA